eukprot:COSAG02_NODE_2169_length_9601_cov_233.346138_2_plen_105_part_00
MAAMLHMDTTKEEHLTHLEKETNRYLDGIGIADTVLQGLCEELRQIRTPQSPKRILCIDGGGIKGLVPALVIGRIEHKCGHPIADTSIRVSATNISISYEYQYQ